MNPIEYLVLKSISEGLHQMVMQMCGELFARFDRVERKLSQMETKMSQELDALAAQVAATESLEDSAVQLITGLAAQIAALKDEPAKLQALSDSLAAKAKALSDAISANTPAPAPAPAAGS